jgi:protein gp37
MAIEPQYYSKIDWVICGGESGSKARPMHPQWARSIRDQCEHAGVPFFFKQWGEWWEVDQIPHDSTGFLHNASLYEDGNYFFKVGKHKAGRLLDGTLHNEYPQTVKELTESG